MMDTEVSLSEIPMRTVPVRILFCFILFNLSCFVHLPFTTCITSAQEEEQLQRIREWSQKTHSQRVKCCEQERKIEKLLKESCDICVDFDYVRCRFFRIYIYYFVG
jgi:hypothetical protein